MLHSSRILIRSLFPIGLLVGIALLRPAMADTTVPISGIGTRLSGDYDIDTHVDRVTYSTPVDVTVNGMAAVEIHGTVSGTGWGGIGIVPRASNAHYRYEIPFVARWRKQVASTRFVFFNHGGGLVLFPAIAREKLAGATNPNRIAETNGDQLVGVPALLNQAAYVSINRRGLRNDGKFSATYLPPVAPLTAAEAANLKTQVDNVPGGPAGFVQPGLAAGDPVPLVPTYDVPTCRDVARALERVVAGLIGQPFRTRIGAGASSGSRLFAAMNFGRSTLGGASVRTGGNHVIPYDIHSQRLFDGYILNGFPYFAGVDHADDLYPLSAPVMFYQGQGDERYQQHVAMVHELLRKRVPLHGCVWIYEIENLTHITRDNQLEGLSPSYTDRLGCFLSAGIRNLSDYVESGCLPPTSRMTGRIVANGLRFDHADGSTTNVVPVAHDPPGDTVVTDSYLSLRTMNDDNARHWIAVTAALPHHCNAIVPPTVACRLGGTALQFFGAQVTPLPPATLAAKFGGFAGYRECVRRTVQCLEAERHYDSRVESAGATANLSQALFP